MEAADFEPLLVKRLAYRRRGPHIESEGLGGVEERRTHGRYSDIINDNIVIEVWDDAQQ